MTTGQLIKEARKKAGMTQKQLGEKLGIAYQTLAQWENDLRNPKYDTIRRIAAALDVEWTELVPEEEQGQQVIDHIKEKLGTISGSTLTYEQQCAIHEADSRNRLETAYARLDLIGHQKVADYAEKLTKDPRRLVDLNSPYHYRRPEPLQSALTSQEPTDTTPPADAPERPQEGEE